jgi:hypothetical protein
MNAIAPIMGKGMRRQVLERRQRRKVNKASQTLGKVNLEWVVLQTIPTFTA